MRELESYIRKMGTVTVKEKYCVLLQTLPDLGASYVPKGSAQVEFHACRNSICMWSIIYVYTN
jgi:hypothetical protein